MQNLLVQSINAKKDLDRIDLLSRKLDKNDQKW